MSDGLWKGMVMVLALGLAAGCSSEELDAAKAELKTCQEKQQSLKQEADLCRQELVGQKQRWDNIQATLASVVPPNVTESQKVIIEKIPEAAREDVQKELDKYFVAVAREIQHLQRKNDELLQEVRSTGGQVASTRKRVDEVKTVADKIEAGVQAVGQCAEQRDQFQERNRQLASKVEQTVATILSFDREQVNCKGCDAQIKMFAKGKERILKFHSSLVSDLTSFQTTLAEEAPAAP